MGPEKNKMRKFLLALTAAGAIGLAASATPAQAGFFNGLKTPAVESNTVQARCHHHRWSSNWHCRRRHHHHFHAYPHYWQPYHFHHHRRHRRHWHW